MTGIADAAPPSIAARPIPWRAPLALMVVAIAAGIASASIVKESPGYTFASGSIAAGVLGLAAGWVPPIVGVMAMRRGQPTFGLLLSLGGIAWLASAWANPGADSAVTFSLGLALGWVYPAVLGHALLERMAVGSGRLRARAIVGVGYVVFGFVLGVVPALTFDPTTAYCLGCPDNLLLVASIPDAPEWAGRLGRALATGWVVVVIAAIVAQVSRQGVASRRRHASFLLAGLSALGLVGFEAGRSVERILPPTDPTDQALRLGQAVAIVALGAAVVLDWLQGRRARMRLAQVVADLGHAPPAGGLRDVLADTLNDEALQIGYPISDGFVDAHGRRMANEERPGRTLTPIVRDGSVVALLDHSVDALDVPERLDDVVATARLGLEHERLQALARAQLDEIRAARRRIVADGDTVRRQLERDLHDGAQQSVVALTVGLQLVPRDTGDRELLDEAGRELRRALDELRRVAHGIHPSVLSDEGFRAAVEGLAEESSVRVVIEELPEERFSFAVEAAAYQVVAELIGRGQGPVRVRASRADGSLIIDVETRDVPGDALVEAGDRVGAADGTLVVLPTAGGVIVRTELPCGS